MKKTNTNAGKAAGFLRYGQNGHHGANGADRPASQAELQAVIQRYVDLFHFAPVGYVNFDRVGRIEEINMAAAQLLGLPRKKLLGSNFATHVVKADLQHFLHHVLRCRSSESRVDTELQLKKQNGETAHVCLSSSPMISRDAQGVPLYRTAIVDFTGRKRSEEAIRESERRYRTLFDYVPTAIYTCDAKGLIVEFNQRAAELWGRKPKINDPTEKYCGSFKIFYPDGRAMAHKDCPMGRALRGEEVPEDEREILVEREDGERRSVAVSPTALRNERGKIVGAINCLYDITDRKRAEGLLAEAANQRDCMYRFVERRHKAESVEDIYDAALDVMLATLHCDRAAILLFDNEGVMRFVASHGLSDRYLCAVEGHSFWKQGAKNTHPIALNDVDLAKLPKTLHKTIRAEGIRACAFVPLIAEGSLIGKVVVYYDQLHDFHPRELNLALNIASQLALGIERKQAEEALVKSEQFHRALVSQTNVGMARSDRLGRFAFVNQTFCEMIGYKKAELVGKRIADVTHPDDRKETRRLFQRIVRDGVPYQLEKRYLRKDGSILWVNVSASPIRDARAKTQSAIAVIVDITDRKKAEVALKKSQLHLEELVERRTQALREINVELESEIERRKGLEGEILSISDREQQRLGQELHDGLCQQLAAIGLMARASALRLKDHRVINVEDLENITQLINDSVISARNIARGLHRDEVDAAGFIQALHALAERKVWQTPCRIEIKTDINISDDNAAAEIYRILREALVNANKHAKATQIVLEVARSNKELVFRVTDNGTGFSKKARCGLGLGFHIMQHRARSIGAHLELESPRRGGARVVCRLPQSQ